MQSSKYYNLSSQNYNSWLKDCVSSEWTFHWTVACLANLELGLRWLHDRCEEDNRSNFIDAMKKGFPSIMTGIAHGLVVLESQQRLTDELKGDRTTMRKLHKRARELTKRRKKNIP